MSSPSDRIFTISNALSLFRVVLTPPLVWALEKNNMAVVIVIIVLAVLSDFFDGYVARHAHGVTNIGKVLDPIADKFIIMGVMIFLLFDPERNFPLYFFLLLALRDITNSIIGSYLMNVHDEVFQSIQSGKWFLSITALAIILYIARLPDIGFWVLAVATVFLLVSWFYYLRRFMVFFKATPLA